MNKVIQLPLYIVLVLLLSTSCTSKGEFKGVIDLKELYKPDTIFVTEKSTSQDKILEVNLTGGNIINKDELKPENIASTSALIIYRYLTKEQQNSYKEIIININKVTAHKNETHSSSFLSKDLKIINFCYALTDGFSDKISKQKYDSLSVYFDTSISMSNDTIKNSFKNIDNQYGRVDSYFMRGYRIIQTEDPIQTILKLTFIWNRGEIKNEVDLYFNLALPTPRILSINY